MKKLIACALLTSVFASPTLAAELPLKRVVITTSGVALYEHQGSVTGNEDIDLPVRLDRVDDMLKSLVVLDNAGTLGGVSLPGREPLAQAFRDLPFSEADLQSPVALLNALRGAAVEMGGVSGKLMNVTEETEQSENGIVTRHRVSVLTPEGIKTALLERLDTLKFTDAKVQEQLSRGLEAVFNNRIVDQRGLRISLLGEGTRDVGLAYIQDAPLWKSSYRLVLPEDGEDGKAMLQGWAVLENTTGQDWDGVNVTLMSGSPVTYQQALYESYHLQRPQLPVKIMDRVMPRVDGGGLGGLAEVEAQDAEYAPRMKAMAAPGAARNMAVADMASMEMAQAYGGSGGIPMPAAPPVMGMAATTSAAASETASQMVFAFPQAVTLAAGNTMMLPFASYELPAEKLYVFQPETNASHPLSAVKIENDTDSALPPGVLTLFDNGNGGLLHVGDAEMPLVPKAEDRFISFALDTKTKIEQKVQDDRKLGLITIANGALSQQVVWMNTATYTIRAPEEESRTIVIEHPRRDGWEMVKPEGVEDEVEVTKNHYRVRVNIDAGETKTLKLTLRRSDEEVIALSTISPQDLASRMAATGKDIPANMRKALDEVIKLRENVATHQIRIRQLEEERQRIFADQQRLRDNLQTVAPNNDLGKRYLTQMNEQENRLDQIGKEEKAAREALHKANTELAEYINRLRL